MPIRGQTATLRLTGEADRLRFSTWQPPAARTHYAIGGVEFIGCRPPAGTTPIEFVELDDSAAGQTVTYTLAPAHDPTITDGLTKRSCVGAVPAAQTQA